MKTEHVSALITGAAGGIGSTVARTLAARGARLLLTDLRYDALEQLAEQIRSSGARVDTMAADIGSTGDIERVAAVAARSGINTLVNVAGVNPFGMLAEQNAAQTELAIRLNLMAPIQLTRCLLPHLISLPDAHVVNVGSMLGAIAMPGYATYGATKGGLQTFSEALRREMSDTGVRVHLIAPRATRTPINNHAVCEMNERLGVRMDEVRVVADAVVRAIESGRPETYVGFPERFYRVVNALFPRVIDNAIRSKLSIIREYATARPARKSADREAASVSEQLVGGLK